MKIVINKEKLEDLLEGVYYMGWTNRGAFIKEKIEQTTKENALKLFFEKIKPYIVEL